MISQQMKRYILAATAATTFAAPNSYASDAVVYCEALSNLAETAAVARDQGTPAANLQAIAAKHQGLNADVRVMAIYLVDMVYHDKIIKHLPPEQVRSAAFVVCLRLRK